MYQLFIRPFRLVTSRLKSYPAGGKRSQQKPTRIVLSLCILLGIACPTWAELSFTLQGEAIPGSLIVGRISGQVEPVEVQVDEQNLRVSPDGVFVFGLGRDANGSFTIKASDSKQTVSRSYTIRQREYDIQRVEGVAQKHVTPPDDVLQRIASEAAKVADARKLDDTRVDFLQPFVWPLIGPITGVYGSQRYYNGVPKSPHYGLDIAAPTGTEVVAPAAGVVTLAEPDLYYSGGTLILDHGHGVSSTFIHLHKLLVNTGEKVQQGQAIAQVGATGRATGPHLDWRMNWFKERLDPAVLMQYQNNPMPAENP